MITQLTPDINGKSINCIIGGEPINNAVIVYEDLRYYILQDVHSGSFPPTIKASKFGKKLSWCVGRGNKGDLFRNQTSNIQIINQEYELY